MPTPLRLSLRDARRFHRRAVLLDQALPNIDLALQHHGYIQIDPINVCGRMHDLILRRRVTGYREGDLMRHLHGIQEGTPLPPEQRTAFEHHLPEKDILAAMPLDAWPFLLAAMRQRSTVTGTWSGKMNRCQQELAKSILLELAARGAVCSDDIQDERKEHQGWGPRASLAKTTLHKLFFHGRVLIARRVGNRRYYALPEKTLPAATLKVPEPSKTETQRWVTLLKLRQRRLVTLSRDEQSHVSDMVQPVVVDGCPPLFCLLEDLPLLDATDFPPFITLLAPLDPLIYDRKLTRQLWGYDYTWEVYTPPSKRVRGYYALPVLSGLELVGHIDPKANRIEKKLTIMNKSVRRGHRSAEAARELAQFLGLR